MKKNHLINCLLFVTLFLIQTFNLKSEINLTGFEWDNSDWIRTGDTSRIADEYEIIYQGKKSLKLGGYKSGIERKINVTMLENVDFAAFVKLTTSNKDSIKIYTKYYDSLNNIITQFYDTSKDTNWTKISSYTIVPPYAKYVVIGFEFVSNNKNNVCYIDYCYWNTNAMAISDTTEINYNEYLQPFWATDTVFNESILMMSNNGNLPSAKLLFQPSQIISITNYNNSKTFIENVDYKIDKKNIVATQNTRMNYFVDTTINISNYWFSLYKKDNNYFPQWLNVTYTHKRDWQYSKIPNKKNILPKTMSKLLNKNELRIATIGMSITKGCSVTGFAGYYPFMPTYFDLFCNYLGKYYYNNIKAYNVAVPGAKVNGFGVNCFEKYIYPLNPDILVVDFGNVDFWELIPNLYKESIIKIIENGRLFNPNIEFILLSNTMFDPNFLPDTSQSFIKTYYSNLRGYQKAMKELESIGIANVDVNTLSDSLFRLKNSKDFMADPLHPNDYMARWYAQSLISALVPVMSGSINKIVNRSNELVLDNLESKVAQSNVGINEIIISNKQDWEFHKLANGNNRILSNDSKLALAVENGELIQTTIRDTASQEWELIPLENQYYKLKNIAFQKYLSMDTINNTILLENESNTNAQQWNIFYSYKKEELTINKDSTLVDYTVDSSHSIQIESNTKWTVTTTANWIHFDKNEGNGNKSLKLNFDENVEKSQRSAVLDISTNGLKKQHYVVQSGSKTNINDSANEKFNVKIIPPTENDDNIYLICEDCLTSNIIVEIYDMTGRNCFNIQSNISNIMKINLDKFTTGQYFIRINNGKEVIINKFKVY